MYFRACLLIRRLSHRLAAVIFGLHSRARDQIYLPISNDSLTGPKALTFDDVAAIIAAASGQPVVYKDIDQEAWISGAIAAGVPADYAVMLRWLTGVIMAGDGSVPAGDVETVTGRPPASFEAFARRNAAAWTTPEGK